MARARAMLSKQSKHAPTQEKHPENFTQLAHDVASSVRLSGFAVFKVDVFEKVACRG